MEASADRTARTDDVIAAISTPWCHTRGLAQKPNAIVRVTLTEKDHARRGSQN